MPRKVILGYGISIDGYIARRNGSIDFLVIDKEGEKVMSDFFAKIDTTIMGRKTAAGHLKQSKSGEMPSATGMSSYVVSRRWKPGKRAGFEDDVALVREHQPRTLRCLGGEIARLRGA